MLKIRVVMKSTHGVTSSAGDLALLAKVVHLKYIFKLNTVLAILVSAKFP